MPEKPFAYVAMQEMMGTVARRVNEMDFRMFRAAETMRIENLLPRNSAMRE